jgi:hypothetical protein
MAGAKKQTPPPIDRPLSRAYLRNFTGWSTAWPPGLSDPTSCRLMENMMVTRDKALTVRPGLRYLSYVKTPDMNAVADAVPGEAFDMPLVGTLEPFYIEGNVRAMLFAVREKDGTVGFRVLILSNPHKTVFRLTDKEIGFFIPQGEESLNFDAATKYVSYVQIDNRILAMSDSGQSSIRLFNVGAEKTAKKLNSITYPDWVNEHKLQVVHPLGQWVAKIAITTRRNELLNPSFEVGTLHWNKGANNEWTTTRDVSVDGRSSLVIWTEPTRTNLATSPLHNVAATGIGGWHPGKEDPKLSKDGDWLKLTDAKGTKVFLAYSAKLSGIEEGKRYQLAFGFELSKEAQLRARIQWYRNNGSEIGDQVKFLPTQKDGRWESPAMEAPSNAVSARIYLGADSTDKGASWAKFRNVWFGRANEGTAMLSGDSGTDCFWLGTPNESKSVYHPTTNVSITSSLVNVIPGKPVAGSMHVNSLNGPIKEVDVYTSVFDRNTSLIGNPAIKTAHSGQNVWNRIGVVNNAGPNSVRAAMQVTIKNVQRGDKIALDGGMLESNAPSVGTYYFDGSSPSTTATVHSWENVHAPHLSPSLRTTTLDLDAVPPPNPTTAKTLISTDATKNTYKMGFFYVFENEIGESAPSKITEIRMQRPQSNWEWLRYDTHDMNNIPQDATIATDVADLCGDQLVAWMPKDVYDSALASGAVRWHLYTFSWSDQDPVPVEAKLAGTRELYPDQVSRQSGNSLPYTKGCWININPSRKFTLDLQPLPTRENRVNYSNPPKARNGLVAADRMIMVGDADAPASIRWTSNRPGEYTKFTAHKGGGVKTLSSGNLNIPGAVVLWQNPQSVDTLTILCIGKDGTSVCYYMSPADVTAQTSSTQVMGFEETTNTPGSVAPYGALVHNNAMFRPTDRALLKSTAQNYNINHKTLSDDISNMWERLQAKHWILSAVHDNRLYFLVNNPSGAPVEDGCLGNEIWMYDMMGGESGTWSRFLIQACGLSVIEYGEMVYIGVVRPDGLYYLDPDARMDDYVKSDRTVQQRPIPWFFEMNTQGANKAHDAWAHLQQVTLTLGDFTGAMEYGIRAKTINGSKIDVKKRFTDYAGSDIEDLSWEAQDSLLVRRDLMEWFFYARSVPDTPGWGQFNTVQYRYTPVSVNVGYEYGSVETFEYARNVQRGNDALYRNGIPEPAQDFGRL